MQYGFVIVSSVMLNQLYLACKHIPPKYFRINYIVVLLVSMAAYFKFDISLHDVLW